MSEIKTLDVEVSFPDILEVDVEFPKLLDADVEFGQTITKYVEHDIYTGPTIVIPASETQVLETKDKLCQNDITIPGELEWVVPEGWPDIEQLPLTDHCMYLLLDGSLACDHMYVGAVAGKGTYYFTSWNVDVNSNMGEPIDHGSYVNSNNTTIWLRVHYHIPEGVPYVVYRIEFEKAPDSTTLGLQKLLMCNSGTYGTNSNSNNRDSNQPIVWIYGKMVDATTQYQNQWGGADTIHLRRYRVYVGPNYGFGYLFNNRVPMHSALINDGDFSNNVNNDLFDGNSNFRQKVVIIRNLKRYFTSAWSVRTCGNSAYTKYVDYSGLTDMNGYGFKLNNFYNNFAILEYLDVSRWNAKITYIRNSFRDLPWLKHLDLSDLDFSECTYFGDNFANNWSLRTLKVNNTWKGAFNLKQSFDFEKESLLELFNTVPDVNDLDHNAITTTCKFVISYPLYINTTVEEKNIAINKGWEVAYT